MTQEQVDVVVEELTDTELDAVGGGGRGYSFSVENQPVTAGIREKFQ